MNFFQNMISAEEEPVLSMTCWQGKNSTVQCWLNFRPKVVGPAQFKPKIVMSTLVQFYVVNPKQRHGATNPKTAKAGQRIARWQLLQRLENSIHKGGVWQRDFFVPGIGMMIFGNLTNVFCRLGMLVGNFWFLCLVRLYISQKQQVLCCQQIEKAWLISYS